jgi:enoyl-CoA hydratase/carnithine racemase
MLRGEEMNTLTHELIASLGDAIDQCVSERARVLVVTGSGRAFCCGAHLRYFAGDTAMLRDPLSARDEYLAHIASTFDRLEQCPFPTIAAVNGYALGGGCELALSCDLRVLSHGARIGLPEAKLGAVAAAGGVQKLIRHVGRSKALEWILLARHIDAATAERHGLASAVVEPHRVLPTALALARELRALGRHALAQSKAVIYASEDADLRTARRYGIDALSLLVGGTEWNEGMSAFIEKRTPRFEDM